MGRNTVGHPHRRRRIPCPTWVARLREYNVVLTIAVLALTAAVAWSYRGVFVGLLRTWRRDDDYSAGQLVPLVAAFLIWRERGALRQCTLTPAWGAGVAVLAAALVLRACGYLLMFWSARDYALILTMAGLVLMVAGWQVLRRIWRILLFLFLMFPLPGTVHNLVSGPLQHVATTGSVFLLEAFGTSVGRQGNTVILAESIPVTVAEACSGLRMLTAFIIVAAFIAYMVKRPHWLKGILLLSSIPIAVVCNVARIFLTATIMLHINEEVGERFFHDFAGLVMMPIAVSLLFGEIWLLDRIVESDEPTARRQMVVRTGSAQRTAPRRRLTGAIGYPEHAADAYSRK
jgi:exosortase